MKKLPLLFIALSLAGLSCNSIFTSGESTPMTPSRPTAPAPTPSAPAPIDGEKAKVSTPIPGALITSPVTVTGQVRGTWYFEASFPVHVVDADGRELGTGIAQAGSDWMTEDYVPFTVSVDFKAPTTATGSIILQKDNPSGDPKHDDSVVIPVKFR